MQGFVGAIRDFAAGMSGVELAIAAAGCVLLALALLRLFLRAGGGGERQAAARHAVMADRLERLIAERQAADDRLEERLREHERALADQMERKLGLSTARIGESLDKSRAATHATLTGLAERIGRIDAAQTRLVDLSGQIAGLERALGDKQARGAFGEARLSDLLRDALPPDAFQEQATLANGRRADALLLLPAPPGPIAIDSKFPLEGFLALTEGAAAGDDKARLNAFARDVSKHVADIAERYILPGVTADCALMFVPSEAVYAEIHARCRKVVEEAFRRRVYIVSPTTLWATLNTARAILRDARIREQSAVIQQEALGLVEDVAKLAGKAEAARRRLELAEADLDGLATAARAAERRGRRLADLDLADDEIGTPERFTPKSMTSAQ